MNHGQRGMAAAVIGMLAITGCQRTLTPVEQGQAYFKGFSCVKCHRVGSEGGTYGPDLTMVGFRKSKEWLDLWLKNPHGWRQKTVMPNFNLTDPVRAGIVEYLSTLKGQDWGPDAAPWKDAALQKNLVKKGEMIFNKAGCVACHAQKGAGGYANNNVVGGLIPALTKVSEAYTKEELEERIRKGSTPEPADPKHPLPMIRMPVWGEVLKEDELDAVVEYLFSLQPKSSGEDW